MTYSVAELVDTVLDALGIEVPERFNDSPSDQADLILAAIARLERRQMPKPGLGRPQRLNAALRLMREAKKLAESAGAARVVGQLAPAITSTETAVRSAYRSQAKRRGPKAALAEATP